MGEGKADACLTVASVGTLPHLQREKRKRACLEHWMPGHLYVGAGTGLQDEAPHMECYFQHWMSSWCPTAGWTPQHVCTFPAVGHLPSTLDRGRRPEKKTRGCKNDFPDFQPPQESYWQGCRVPPLAQRRRLEGLPGQPGMLWRGRVSGDCGGVIRLKLGAGGWVQHRAGLRLGGRAGVRETRCLGPWREHWPHL